MHLPIPEIAVLQSKIDDAIQIATYMIGEEVEDDIRLSYCRSILRSCDRLSEVKEALNSITQTLHLCEDELGIDRFTEPNSEDIISAFRSAPQPGIEVGDSVKRKTTTAHEAKALRPTMKIRVTAGMIRQNLLTFTGYMAPKGSLNVGDRIKISLNGEIVDSEIVAPGNKLRSRGTVGRFYQDMHVRPGDYVVLTVDDSGVWHTSLERSNHLTARS